MRQRRFGRTLEGLSISVDGYDWEECNFKDCEIILAEGDLSMAGCNFRDCRLTLRDKALAVGKIIELFMKGKPVKFINKGKTL